MQNPNHTLRPGFRVCVYEPEPGFPVLHITEKEDEEGTEGRDIPLAAIASRMELLGYADPIEAVEALIYMQDYGVPDCCPKTGRQAYTDPYTVLRQREIAREETALLAEEQGFNREGVIEASTMRAFDEVHQPIAGGDCLCDRVRAQARAEIGLPEPSTKCGADSRVKTSPLPEKPSVVTMSQSLMPLRPADERREQIIEALRGQEEDIQYFQRHFLHHLTDNDADPVTPEPEPEAPDAFEQLQAHYQQEGASA